ncbi:MAG: cytochrome c [Alphaproteobacteria bacterium]
MRRASSWARASALLAALLVLAPLAGRAEPARARQSELRAMLDQDCGSCHGLTRKGGLGPALLPDRLAGRSDADLIAVILNGSAAQPMPPWGFLIDAEDAAWLVAELRRGVADDE